MSISEELELDISGALDAIESLNQPLTELGTNLTDSLTTAIEAVDIAPLVDQLASLDASGVTTAIDSSIDEVDGIVPIEADAAEVPGEIDTAIDEADTTVVIEADAAEIPGEIDSSIDGADTTVTIDADASGVGAEIQSEIDSADTSIEIEADVSGLEDIADASGGASSGLDNVTEAAGGLESAASGSLGAGALGGLSSTLAKAGPLGIAAGAGVGVLAAGFTKLIEEGLPALGTVQRFNSTFGELKNQVSTINFGTLNKDLAELALSLGSDDEAALDAASSIFQIGKAGDFSDKKAVVFTESLIALAARAVALNPALGDVGSVAVQLTRTLATGGTRAAKFGLALSSGEIQARAFANTGKTATNELTTQELAFAGAQIAGEKYGKGIDKEITKGTKNVVIQQRALNEEINNFFEEAGAPLIKPFLKSMKELEPVLEIIAKEFGELGKEFFPAAADALTQLAPTIQIVADLLKLLNPIIRPLNQLINATINPVGTLLGLFQQFDDLPDIGAFFSGIGDAIGGFLANVVGFGADIIGSFLSGITTAFGAVVSFFASIGTTIFDTIGDVLTTITQKGTDLITGLFTGISTAVVAVFTFFRDLAGTVFTTIGDVVGTLIQKGTDFIGGLLSGITQKATEVFNFFTDLPGRIIRTVGRVAKTLFNAGADLIQGLIDGIVDKAGDIVKILKKKVTDIIPGFIKDALDIGSPSKVLMRIGEDIGEGLIVGLDNSLAGIKSASASMAAAALPIPGVGALPAVAAALPTSATGAASTAGSFTADARSDLNGGAGVVIQNLVVQTTAKDQTQVGIEVARQLRAESFRAGR